MADDTPTVRVYCLPHAGGSADSYRSWTKDPAAQGLDFVPVELPGHGTRRGEQPLTSMTAVTDEVLALLAARPAGEPFILLGHSMGAHIAYETARRLAAAGRTLPRAAVLSGCRPVGPRSSHPLHDLSDSALVDKLILLGTPAEILERPCLVRALLPAFRADLRLMSDYAQQVRPTPLPCPVVAFGGAEDTLVAPEEIGEWSALTSVAFRHRILPGGHFFLYENLPAVLAGIRPWSHPKATSRPPLAHPEREEIRLEAVLGALGDPLRMRIVRQLATGDGEFAYGRFKLPVSKSTATHHFRVLREGGVIRQYYRGAAKVSVLRGEDLDALYPGLLDSVVTAVGRESERLCHDGRRGSLPEAACVEP